MKRITSLILCAVLLICLLPTVGAANVVEITDKAGFAAIASGLNGSYVLKNDLQFTDDDFAVGGVMHGKLPFGTFTGTLDGDGHIISGLQIAGEYIGGTDVETSGGETSVALFSHLSGTVKNVEFRNAKITYDFAIGSGLIMGDFRAAVVAATMTKSAVMQNVAVKADIAVEGQGKVRLNVGGLAGFSQGSVENCAFYGKIAVSRDVDVWTTVGGIIGQNDEEGTTVSKVFSVYDATYDMTDGAENLHAGAVAGYNSGLVEFGYFPAKEGLLAVGKTGTGGQLHGETRDCVAVAAADLGKLSSYAGLSDTVWSVQQIAGAKQAGLLAFECAHANVGALTTVLEPTCGTEGIEGKPCYDCGEIVETNSLPATGEHVWDRSKYIRGDEAHWYACSNPKCDAVTEYTLHTEGAQIVDTPPTCNESGLGHTECTVCTMPVQTAIVIPATGEHIAGDWTVLTPATATQKGVKVKKCTVCETELERASIPATGKEAYQVFTDVKKKDWFHKAVTYAYNHNLFTGTTKTTFGPNDKMTRGMFVTVLGRLAGAPNNNKVTTVFTDVKKGQYYTAYVKWANENGIVSGTSATTFGPEENITREQICAIMVRYCSFAKITLKKVNAPITFKDANKISSYARAAVKACQQGGLVNGEGNAKNGYTFRPQGNATRAEVATIIMNFAETYK